MSNFPTLERDGLQSCNALFAAERAGVAGPLRDLGTPFDVQASTGTDLSSRRDGAGTSQIRQAFERPTVVPDGTLLIERGERIDSATLLVDGYLLRSVCEGEKRSIVGVHVPGDLVDLPALLLEQVDYDVVAAGPACVARLDHDTLRRMIAEQPTLAGTLWRTTLQVAAINRRWISNLQQLHAPQRIAHLFTELRCRLSASGRKVSHVLRTPFKQTDLADICGVSAIHANRAVARLRELGIATIRRGDFYTSDWTAVERYAEFEPSYLMSSRHSK